MRFLIDANMPRQTSALLGRHGHDAVDVRDINLGAATDDRIAEHAQREGRCILTRDWGFGDIRRYRPSDHAGIVVFGLPETATADFILRVVESLLREDEVMSRLSGVLVIVEPGQIRIRSVDAKSP